MSIASIIAKPLLAITPDKEINWGPWGDIGMAALTGATNVGIHRLASGSFKNSVPLAVAGLVTGGTMIPLNNVLVRYKHKLKLEEAEKAIHDHLFPESDPAIDIMSLQESLKNIIKHAPNLSKQASWSDIANIAATGINTINKGIGGTTKFIGKALLTNKQSPLPQRIVGGAVKAGVLGTAGYGTYKGIQRVKNNQSYDYNTMLRNNILAGKINPAELNSSEAIAVKKKGWM